MDLESLFWVFDHQRDTGKEGKTIKIMGPDGARYDVLSLSWDRDEEEWVIVGE